MNVKQVGWAATAAFTGFAVYQFVQTGRSNAVVEQVLRLAVASISIEAAVALAQTVRSSAPNIPLRGENGLYAKFKERFELNGRSSMDAIDSTIEDLGARIGQYWCEMRKEPQGTIEGHPACGGIG